MEPEVSLPRSQESAIRLYSESHESSAHLHRPLLFQIRFNISLPSTSMSYKFSSPQVVRLTFSTHFSSLPCMPHTPPIIYLAIRIIFCEDSCSLCSFSSALLLPLSSIWCPHIMQHVHVMYKPLLFGGILPYLVIRIIFFEESSPLCNFSSALILNS